MEKLNHNKKQKFLKKAKKWSKEAGKYQKEKINSKISIKSKDTEIDLVTEIDEKSEEIITNHIKKEYPEHSILAEEKSSKETDSEFKWIIDPIDGTINYAHKFPIYCISIALKHREKVKIGAIHVPTFNETYTAIRGQGAYMNGNPIKVSNCKNLNKAILATGFPYDRKISEKDNVDNFKNMIKKIGGIRRIGTAAYELTQVAKGVFDGYWEMKMNPWDIAAGILLVKEAGGKVTNIKGEEIEDEPFVIAGNKNINEKIIEELTKNKNQI